LLGIIFVVVFLSVILAIFVVAQDSPNDAADSFNDGYNNASSVTVGSHPTVSEIEAACRSTFGTGLPGQDVTVASLGCLNVCRHRRIDLLGSPRRGVLRSRGGGRPVLQVLKDIHVELIDEACHRADERTTPQATLGPCTVIQRDCE